MNSRSDWITLSKAQLWTVALVAIAALINYFGSRAAGRLQILVTGLKVGALVAIAILGRGAQRMSRR